jgi:hypothetical protein
MPKKRISLKLPFVTKYHRPKKFSNPFKHFSSETLSDILKKTDYQLQWFDFNKIFHYENPAGTYSEIIYFLPWAFKFLEEHPQDSIEFLRPLFFFVSSEEKKLQKDNLFEPSLNAMKLIFKKWTSAFQVVHFGKEECKKKQWNLDYYDIVENSQIIYEIIDSLCLHNNLLNVAIYLIKFLSDIKNEPVRSAWFLEYEYSTWQRYEMFSKYGIIETPDELDFKNIDMIPTKKIPGIFKIVSDKELVHAHYSKIENNIVKKEKSPTYWRDLRAYLHR